MRFRIILCLGLFLLPIFAPVRAQQIDEAVSSLATEIMESLRAQGKTKVAIAGFTDLSGRTNRLGKLISEEFASQLFERSENSLTLVERGRLHEVLGEKRLEMAGILEKTSVEAFGKILGIEAIILGTVADIDTRVRINVRLIAVPSAEVFSTARAYMSKSGLDASYFEPISENEAEEVANQTKGRGQTGPAATQDYGGVTYDFFGCSQEVRFIVCRFVLTNNRADREFRFIFSEREEGFFAGRVVASTFLFDQGGRKVFASRARLAGLERFANYRSVSELLIADVPTDLTVYFEDPNPAVEFIKILNIAVDNSGSVRFRDIQLDD